MSNLKSLNIKKTCIINEVKKMTVKEAFKEFFKLYLLALAVTLTVIAFGTLIYAMWTTKPFMEVMRYGLVIGALVLLGVGFVSMLPLSEYRYMKGAGLNPVIAREGIKHVKAGRDPKRMGIIFGIVGLTLLLIYFIIFP
jgi:ABC-type transport system involved in cytochrome c biogenesis permease subunit